MLEETKGFSISISNIPKSSIAQFLSLSFVVLIEYMWSLLRASSCGGWGDPHNKTAPSLYIKGVPSPCTPPPFVPSLPHAVNIGC